MVTHDSGCEDIPTCVAFTEDEVLVGTAAEAQARKNPANTFSGFTCLLRDSTDCRTKSAMEYKKSECQGLRQRGRDLVLFVPFRQRHYTLVELTALLLARCRWLAGAHCSTVTAAVCITTSSTWSCVKLRALAEAAEIAGIDHPIIVPNAIARAYEYEYATRGLLWTRQTELPIVVIDVGARGFAISLVNISSSPGSPQPLHLVYHGAKNYGVSIENSTLSINGNYSQDLEDDLGIVWPAISMKIRNLCLFTGSLSLLHSVQSIIQQHISENTQSDSPRVIPIYNALENAAKGAAGLAFRPCDIKETFLYELGLHVRGKRSFDKYLTLFPTMSRGQQYNPWVTTVQLLPASSQQNGLFLAVFKNETLAGPQLLFQAAIKPAVIGELYSLVVSVSRDCNIDFKLQCHIDGQDDVIQAEIRCTSSGVIDFRSGSFVTQVEDRQTKWLLKPLQEESEPSSVDKAEREDVKPAPTVLADMENLDPAQALTSNPRKYSKSKPTEHVDGKTATVRRIRRKERREHSLY
jgi:Hsp70 protein